MTTLAVDVKGLTRTFDRFVAVDHIDLHVEAGTVFGFLGPNGAGKSTTIRMLCGILRPTAGGGTVGGFDIVRQTEQLKSHIGYMSQRFSLYEDLTVAENLLFFAGIYSVRGSQRDARIAWALEMAGLHGREHLKTAELAGGWRQRLALGCAVLHEPPILFLDEPTSGVDPASRRNFWEMIGELSSRGITVFVTTHYMDEAEHCDELALIYGGQVVATGSPVTLKRRYMSRALLELDCSDLMAAYAEDRADTVQRRPVWLHPARDRRRRSGGPRRHHGGPAGPGHHHQRSRAHRAVARRRVRRDHRETRRERGYGVMGHRHLRRAERVRRNDSMKFDARNPKFETNSERQIRMTKRWAGVSDFELGISDFKRRSPLGGQQ
jgi:ABC-2 type transport system ATP-binding protein